MTGFNPGGLERPKGCRFLEDLTDGSTTCRIKSGSVKWERLSENVKRYYQANCVNYPDPEDPDHTPPRHSLPEGCGYRMIWVED